MVILSMWVRVPSPRPVRPEYVVKLFVYMENNKTIKAFMTEQELEKFQVFSCNSSVWLVDSNRKIATHCSDITWNREEYDQIYPATAANYQEFLADPLFAGCR